jgi:deoxyribodipyrimidine photo-lyase
MPPGIVWLRQDLRVSDQRALAAALAEGPVLPVYVLDDDGPGGFAIGGAQRWWLHHSLAALAASLAKRGSRLILRRGRSAEVLADLLRETGAHRIHALHHYEPWHRAAEAQTAGIAELVLHHGNQLAPPAMVLNGAGQRYRVFTPWYAALRAMMPPAPPLPAPETIPAPASWPGSDDLDDWRLLPRDPDWSNGFAFLDQGINDYARALYFPAAPGTSRLSPHLHFGEISPATVWHAAEGRGAGAAAFLRELGWRDYGTNLVDQFPDYATRNGRPVFDRFGWREGPEAEADFRAWTRGRTGYPVVDAGMRELWQTGWMHNRVRMIAASFLIKHLLIDWRRGERWFRDTLLDADLGANASNWQYVAGSGVDAPVFSRIMAPYIQSEKFAMADYVRRFVPELTTQSDRAIHAMHLGGDRPAAYPQVLIGHEAARARALAAWEAARETSGD